LSVRLLISDKIFEKLSRVLIFSIFPTTKR